MSTSSNKKLLIINNISGEYSSNNEAFVISDDKLDYFYGRYDSQSSDATDRHVVIIFNDELKSIVKRYMPLLSKYIELDNNKIHIRYISSSSTKYVNALLTDNTIDSYENIKELTNKGITTYYSDVFILFLKAIMPKEYQSNLLNDISSETCLKELDELLKSDLKEEFEPLKEITSGEYPQEIEKDQVIIDKLNQLYLTPDQNKDWLDFDDRANDYNGPYMFYIDVILDNQKYRGVYLKEYRPASYGENIARNHESGQMVNGYKLCTTYWFKYLPITWLAIKEKEGLYLSKYVLDAESASRQVDKYQDDLSNWLNHDFNKTAFNKETNNVGLLDINEYKELIKSKEIRKAIWSDYALIKGFITDVNRWYDPFVWTSSEPKYSRVPCIAIDGTIIDCYIENYGYYTLTFGGIRPALGKYKEPVIKEKKEEPTTVFNDNDELPF